MGTQLKDSYVTRQEHGITAAMAGSVGAGTAAKTRLSPRARLENTLLARRYGDWFAEPEVHPGVSVPDAQHNADHIERALLEGGVAWIDSDGIGRGRR
jgi:hypothetical protein